MTKAKLVAAMPVGSKWNGFHYQGGKWVPLKGGMRTVEAHRSTFMTMAREDAPIGTGPAILDYPKRKDITEVEADGDTIALSFRDEKGDIWSRVRYEKVN